MMMVVVVVVVLIKNIWQVSLFKRVETWSINFRMNEKYKTPYSSYFK
jgi:hypothetical protein